MSVNKVILVGRLGADPETKVIGDGKTVCNLSVATSDKWKDKDGNAQEKTEWHRVQAWGKLAEICAQFLSKGRQVYVEGSLQTRSWEDEQGNKRYATDIRASSVQFLGGKGESSVGFSPEPSFDSEEEIPF